METLIQGTVCSLGFVDEDGQYCPEPDCYESLRDLIRYLRNDTNTFVARRIIGERNIVENDLIPLLKGKHNDKQIFDIIIRLMINLIQPTVVTFMGKEPEGLDQLKLCYQMEDNLRKAKLAFTEIQVFIILKEKLQNYFIDTDWDDRTEEDRLVMERIIVLIRYILSISSYTRDEKRTILEADTHDRVLLAFLDSGTQNILLHIASDSQEKDFHLSILEIVGYIIKEHNPDDIVSAGSIRTDEEKNKAEQELRQIFKKEQEKVFETKRRMLGSRHSRFGGTYWVDGLNSINKENKFFTAKPIMNVNQVSFLDERKKKSRTAKNRRVCDNIDEMHLSSLELRKRIKVFAEDVLARAFNRLMRNTKNLALNGNNSLTHKNADNHYFLIMKFFLRYCRLTKIDSSMVESCIGVECFHTLQLKIDDYLENATLQKTLGRSYGIKAQYAVTAYKELILFTQYLVEHGNAEEKEEAHAICKHILNVEEYRELGISLLKKLQPAIVSKTFLRELILATHYYFRMLEKSVKNGELTSVLKKHKKKKTKKVTKVKMEENSSSNHPCDGWEPEQLDLIWARICEVLSDVVMDHIPVSETQIAYNAMLNCTDEEQQQFAMLRIQRLLRKKQISEAVGLYRSCRDIWYVDDIFGTKEMDPEEEFIELRNIFYTDLNEIANNLAVAERKAEETLGTSTLFQDEYESEDEESDYETKEIAFDFNAYIVRFAASDVIKWYIFMLSDFEKNNAEFNKALVKMLHRIAFDLKMHCRLFQLSLFRILQRVYQKITVLDPNEQKKSEFFELYTFGFHLLKRFFKRFEEIGEKMAPEPLFFKGSKETYELEFGYGSYQHNREETKLVWTEELEEELRSLHNDWKDMDERPEGMDLLDFVQGNLSRERSRGQIQKKLNELGLDLFGAKRSKGADNTFPIFAMKDLVERFNDMDDNSNLDLVDWLRTSLEEKNHVSFSRQKIIKQLVYAGISYEKKKKNKSRANKHNNFINDNEEQMSDNEKENLEIEKEHLSLDNSDNEKGDMGTRSVKVKSQTNLSHYKRKILIDSDDDDTDNSDELETVKRDELLNDKMYQNDYSQGKKNHMVEVAEINPPNTQNNVSMKRKRILSSDESDKDEVPSVLSNLSSSQKYSHPKARKILLDSDEEV